MRFIARNSKRRRRARGGPQRPDSPVVQPPPDTNPLWSDSATWGGSVPTTNDAVIIPEDTIIVLDVDTAALGQLTINGTLKFKDATNLTLSASGITIPVGGRLEVGSPASPFTTAQAVIELTGAFSALTPDTTFTASASTGTNSGVSRGIIVEGALVLVGNPLTRQHTTLAASSAASASSFSLADAPGWRSGDQIVFGGTDFYGTASGTSSPLTLSGDSSSASISTTSTLAAARYGVLQYATDAGISLTPGTFTPNATPHPDTLDERAPVINTTRNIKVQGKNDTHWSTNGHGVHIMAMGTASLIQLDSVEIKRGGQKGALGRYPMHWHMISYNEGTGSFVADTSGHFMKNCAVWESTNRAITIHGTNGVLVDNNVMYDIKGHALFLEDGSERRNTITNNVAMKVRDPGAAFRIKVHDTPGIGTWGGPTGFWMTNPDNTVSSNRAVDCEGPGMWFSVAGACFGNSSLVSLSPRNLQLGTWSGNICHTNGTAGFLADFAMTDNLGNVLVSKYNPTTTGNVGGSGVGFIFHQQKNWKNTNSGYTNRTTTPTYSEWVSADNYGTDFQGATDAGTGPRCLCVATSLNTSASLGSRPRNGFATYHGTLAFPNSTFIDYAYSAPVLIDINSGALSSGAGEVGGGAMRINDLYLRPVETHLMGNTGIKMVGTSIPGYMSRPPFIDGNALNNRIGVYSGAIKDTLGILIPSPGYWLFDDPFLTSGATIAGDVSPAGDNGVYTTANKFYGVHAFYTTFDPSNFAFSSQVTMTRVDNSLATLGEWAIGTGNPSFPLAGRFFSVMKTGRYILTFPGNSPPASICRLNILNAEGASDNFVIAMPWSNLIPPKVYFRSGSHPENGNGSFIPSANDFTIGRARALTSTSSRALVEAGAGDLYWWDSANSRVWIKWVGGLSLFNIGDEVLDNPMQINVVPA